MLTIDIRRLGMSFKHGDLIRFKSEDGKNGYGVVINRKTAFTIVGGGGRTAYITANRLLQSMQEVSPLRDHEVSALSFEVQLALQAVVTAIN